MRMGLYKLVPQSVEGGEMCFSAEIMVRSPDIHSSLKGGLLFLCTLTENHIQYFTFG